MKKLSLFIIVFIATCTVALAQPRAIGMRIGWGIGASYQHSMGEKNMIQADLDIAGFMSIQGTATYNWIFPIAMKGPGTFNLYAGVGLGLGYAWWGDLIGLRRGYSSYLGRHWGLYYGYSGRSNFGCFFVGVAGQFGAEYNFKFPLQVFADFRPIIGPCFYKKGYGYFNYKKYENWEAGKARSTDFYLSGLVASSIVIGARYKF
ncbi:MAG: hypothetical protein LBU83_04735 [Bacteroidales bacterium]|jgi:hypothetical protein|nr:hypothetical protein [Bacteroidales bacterium]